MAILNQGNKQLSRVIIETAEGCYHKHAEPTALIGSFLNTIKSQLTALCFGKINIFEDCEKPFNLCLNDISKDYFAPKSRQNSCIYLHFIQLLQALNLPKFSTLINNIPHPLDEIRQKWSFNLIRWIDHVDTNRIFNTLEKIALLIRSLNDFRLSKNTKINLTFKVI